MTTDEIPDSGTTDVLQSAEAKRKFWAIVIFTAVLVAVLLTLISNTDLTQYVSGTARR